VVRAVGAAAFFHGVYQVFAGEHARVIRVDSVIAADAGFPLPDAPDDVARMARDKAPATVVEAKHGHGAVAERCFKSDGAVAEHPFALLFFCELPGHFLVVLIFDLCFAQTPVFDFWDDFNGTL
jgi:hypothetical protein